MAKVDLFPDFREFLELLNSEKIRYLVIGGYAVVHYGYRRATDDLDIWVAVDEQNAAKLSRALQRFGFSPSKVPPSLFQQIGKVFIFGREPVRIDILTSPDGIDFEECFARRRDVLWDGVRVPLVSLDDLRANKQASGRDKDRADLTNLPTRFPIPKAKKRTPRKRRR